MATAGPDPIEDEAIFALPRPLEHVVEGLFRRVVEKSEAQLEGQAELSPDRYPDVAFHLRAATMAENALKDMRGLVNAYVHAVAQPRPRLQGIAAAQGVTPSNLRRRYKPIQVAAVRELLAERPVADVVQFAFPSVADGQLVGLTSLLDGDLVLRQKIRAAESMHRLNMFTGVVGPKRALELAESKLAALAEEWYGPGGAVLRDYDNQPLSMLPRPSVEGAAAELGTEFSEYLARELKKFEVAYNDLT